MDNSTQKTESMKLAGWTPESSGRGTLSLISCCLFTTFLCTWVVIHPRMDCRKKFRLPHKLALTFKAILAPELIAVEAAQEWTQAHRIVKKCATRTGREFKLVHAFYVGMFGIRYRTASGTKILWPNQFVWLLEQGIFTWDQHPAWGLAVEDINERSNADSTAKAFALAQVSWFVAQSIMRVVHHLPLAQFESMTLAYIPLFALTYFFWWVKPKDLETPTTIDLPEMSESQMQILLSMTISDLFDDEGKPEQNSFWAIWALTPRDFEKEEEDRELLEQAKQRAEQEKRASQQTKSVSSADVASQQTQSVSSAEKLSCTSPPSPPLKKAPVVSQWDPELYHSRMWPVACLFGASFGALHLISWNAVFPTLVELWLWRCAALTSMITLLIFMQFRRVVLRWQDPLLLVKILSPAIYLLSRGAMLVEAFAAFRGSDPAIYQTYVVSTYWVHLL